MFIDFAKPALRLLVVTTALSPVFAAAAYAADPAPAPITTAQAETTAADSPKMHKSARHHQAGDPVETRIADLHAKLKITAAEEPQWNDFAQTMRDNAKTMRPLIQARLEDKSERNAVDDLKSYQAITDAHADALKHMIPSFEALYNVLSDDQKKTADTLFAKYEGRHGGHMGRS